MKIQQRPIDRAAMLNLAGSGMSPIEAQLLASRGVTAPGQLAGALGELVPNTQMKGVQEAARYLLDAIQAKKRICVVADYDCDGATACAVAVRGLQAFGADVTFRVPDRQIHGYGLTESIVQAIVEGSPDVDPVPGVNILVTVDNGTSSFGGVAEANKYGLDVIVTDHHLAPPQGLPPAKVLVNPNQPGCDFPSKCIAGCGVIWYVLWGMQDLARALGRPIAPGFKVSQLLPLVAVGTVADVVTLDRNNRILVEGGLTRIREGNAFVGIEAILAVPPARTQPNRITTMDVAFGVGPRINAAGRLADMSTGIQCLLTSDLAEADRLAKDLCSLNAERQEIEGDIVAEAMRAAERQAATGRHTLVEYQPSWHQGVIGIVAGRIKEKLYRPTFVLTAVDPEDSTAGLKGSGRSVPGVHLKDLLDYVDKFNPGLLKKFGGHSMAAGITLREGGLEAFREGLEAAFNALASPDALKPVQYHDGPLTKRLLGVSTIRRLKLYPWGQNFPEPAFIGEFEVLSAKITGQKKTTLKLMLNVEGTEIEAVRFRHEGPLPQGKIRAIVKLDINYVRKVGAVPQLMIDWMEGA